MQNSLEFLCKNNKSHSGILQNAGCQEVSRCRTGIKRFQIGFEIQGRRHQKSKTGVSVAPENGWDRSAGSFYKYFQHVPEVGKTSLWKAAFLRRFSMLSMPWNLLNTFEWTLLLLIVVCLMLKSLLCTDIFSRKKITEQYNVPYQENEDSEISIVMGVCLSVSGGSPMLPLDLTIQGHQPYSWSLIPSVRLCTGTLSQQWWHLMAKTGNVLNLVHWRTSPS